MCGLGLEYLYVYINIHIHMYFHIYIYIHINIYIHMSGGRLAEAVRAQPEPKARLDELEFAFKDLLRNVLPLLHRGLGFQLSAWEVSSGVLPRLRFLGSCRVDGFGFRVYGSDLRVLASWGRG